MHFFFAACDKEEREAKSKTSGRLLAENEYETEEDNSKLMRVECADRKKTDGE